MILIKLDAWQVYKVVLKSVFLCFIILFTKRKLVGFTVKKTYDYFFHFSLSKE